MKETIYTIPLNDAFHAEDECPFCYLERDAEQHALEFILGSQASYMEDDIRMETDKMGFCRHHYKMMYDYGNRLGWLIAQHTLKKTESGNDRTDEGVYCRKIHIHGTDEKDRADAGQPKNCSWTVDSPKREHLLCVRPFPFQLRKIFGHLLLYVQKQPGICRAF